MAKSQRKKTQIFRGDPRIITIYNANLLVLEGVERIVFCDSDKMILRNRFYLEILGEDLHLFQLGNDNVAVKGKISSLSFSEEEK